MILKHDLLGFSPLLNTLMLEETVGSSFRCYIQSLPTLRPRMAKFARRGLQGSRGPDIQVPGKHRKVGNCGWVFWSKVDGNQQQQLHFQVPSFFRCFLFCLVRFF